MPGKRITSLIQSMMVPNFHHLKAFFEQDDEMLTVGSYWEVGCGCGLGWLRAWREFIRHLVRAKVICHGWYSVDWAQQESIGADKRGVEVRPSQSEVTSLLWVLWGGNYKLCTHISQHHDTANILPSNTINDIALKIIAVFSNELFP